jgi:AcrR family transcriptional regulator
MTGKERREQLIGVSRALFAEKGFDGTSIEEIAASAKVSKPVVYEHFGAKEGIYAVVVDREMQRLLSMVSQSLVDAPPRLKLERAALAMLQYIEESSEGFRILVRDSHAASGTGTFASLISEIANQVEDVLAEAASAHGYDPRYSPMYAQMLVGMVALTGQWWLDVRHPPREEVAAHVVNLAWNGLNALDPHPTISPESRGLIVTPPPATVTAAPLTEKERREQEKARERQFKEREKQRREREKARARELREQAKLAARKAKLAERGGGERPPPADTPPAEVRPDVHSDVRSDIRPDVHSDIHSDVHADVRSDIHADGSDGPVGPDSPNGTASPQVRKVAELPVPSSTGADESGMTD